MDFYTVRGYEIQKKDQDLLTASLEDYLEMIYREILKNGSIGVNALAHELNVKPSSASKMIGKLKTLGLIDYEKYGVIRLTELGIERGKYMLWRHNVMRRFFELICQEQSERVFEEAELSEHILSQDTVKRIEQMILFFEQNPNVLQSFQESCR